MKERLYLVELSHPLSYRLKLFLFLLVFLSIFKSWIFLYDALILLCRQHVFGHWSKASVFLYFLADIDNFLRMDSHFWWRDTARCIQSMAYSGKNKRLTCILSIFIQTMDTFDVASLHIWKKHLTLLLLIFILFFHCKHLFLQLNVVLLQLQWFFLVLVEFIIEVFMGVVIAINLFLQPSNIRLFFNHLLLGISHNFVPIYLRVYMSDLLLNWFAVLSKKFQTIVYEFILSFVESGYVWIDMFVVEYSGPLLHFIMWTLIYLLTDHKLYSNFYPFIYLSMGYWMK